MQSIEISWTELCHHSTTINVPDDFDIANHHKYDLENDLAQLTDDGFECCERTIESVTTASKPGTEDLVPTLLDE